MAKANGSAATTAECHTVVASSLVPSKVKARLFGRMGKCTMANGSWTSKLAEVRGFAPVVAVAADDLIMDASTDSSPSPGIAPIV